MSFVRKVEKAEAASDVLDQKRNKLNAYNQQFERAVSLVTDTIDRLDDISHNIDDTLREIEDYEHELAVTKAGLADTKAKNDRVVANFRALLSTD